MWLFQKAVCIDVCVPQHRQGPEPLIHPFHNLSAVKKEADVLRRVTKSSMSLTSLVPSPTSQSFLEFVISDPDWEQIPDQLWHAGTRLRNIV